jgi:hypothetical protein
VRSLFLLAFPFYLLVSRGEALMLYPLSFSLYTRIRFRPTDLFILSYTRVLFVLANAFNSALADTPHSDVKPDNILLDERGHAHLTDFNIAVHFSERRALTSVAGSMAYMAPEVLLKRGYTYTVDWWSLGVTGWELLFGKRPFRGKTNSALTQCILRDSLKLPENKPQQVSEECMDSPCVTLIYMLIVC